MGVIFDEEASSVDHQELYVLNLLEVKLKDDCCRQHYQIL